MTPEEWFDVVDGDDRVIDRRPRSEVHQRGLKHRAVHVLVFNGRGEVFLQRRSMSKDCHPGVWDSSASGHLGVGETYDACALRELEEELGWVPSRAPERLFKVEACEATGQEFLWVYRCAGEGPFALHPGEIDEGRWCAPGGLAAWMRERPEDFAPGLLLIWDRLTARRLS